MSWLQESTSGRAHWFSVTHYDFAPEQRQHGCRINGKSGKWRVLGLAELILISNRHRPLGIDDNEVGICSLLQGSFTRIKAKQPRWASTAKLHQRDVAENVSFDEAEHHRKQRLHTRKTTGALPDVILSRGLLIRMMGRVVRGDDIERA